MKINLLGLLLMAFGALMIVIAALSLNVLKNIGELSEAETMLYEHPFAVSNAVLRIDSNIMKIRNAMQEMIEETGAEKIYEQSSKIDSYESDIYSDIELVKARFLGDPQKITEFEQLFADWKPIRQEIFELIRLGEKEKATEIVHGKSEEQIKKMEASVQAFSKYASDKARELHKIAVAVTEEYLYTTYLLISTAIATAIFLLVYFAGVISSPIKTLQKATEKVEKGNFKVRVKLKSVSEIERLAESFNKTISALEYTGHEREQLEKTKTEFLSITSHELRSPMTPMKTQMQMLMKGYFGKLNSEQENALEIILRNTTRLDNIISDFLEISRIEAARLKFNFVKTDLVSPIKSLVREMDGFMPEKNIEIIPHIDPLPVIEADPDRISQVLRNLINNAKKFSGDNSKIYLNVKTERGYILFSVKDSGIGISPEKAKSVFDPFFQAEQTIYRKYGGTGLGLTICRGIVESQNGRIWVESKLGKGSVFHFTVPLKPVKKMKPIKMLFSKGEEIETRIKDVFINYFGPLGEAEFETLNIQGLKYNFIIKDVNELAKKGVIDNATAHKFLKEIRGVFGIE